MQNTAQLSIGRYQLFTKLTHLEDDRQTEVDSKLSYSKIQARLRPQCLPLNLALDRAASGHISAQLNLESSSIEKVMQDIITMRLMWVYYFEFKYKSIELNLFPNAQ